MPSPWRGLNGQTLKIRYIKISQCRQFSDFTLFVRRILSQKIENFIKPLKNFLVSAATYLKNCLEESEIIAKIRDPASRNVGFSLLVKAYQQRVYWHVRKMVVDHDDADDLTQTVFIKIWKHIDSYRGEARLFTWIYRIATNECLNFLQQKRRRFFLPLHDLSKELSAKVDEDPLITGDEIQMKLQKALLRLPDKQRLVFNMKYFDAMKFEDIAEVTGTSVGALKASYHHAVKKIEDFLTND